MTSSVNSRPAFPLGNLSSDADVPKIRNQQVQSPQQSFQEGMPLRSRGNRSSSPVVPSQNRAPLPSPSLRETPQASAPNMEEHPRFRRIAIDTAVVAPIEVQLAARDNPATFGKDFADRIKVAATGEHRIALVSKALDDAYLSKEALSSLASHAHEALMNGLGDDAELGKLLFLKLDRGLNTPLTLESRREMMTHAKEAFDACRSDELKKSWAGLVAKMVRHAIKRDGQSMESLAPDQATRDSFQDLLKYK